MSQAIADRGLQYACSILTALSLTVTSAWAGSCGFRHAFTRSDERGTASVKVYEGDSVVSLGGKRPLLFITSLKVNTDGTKISYHPNDPTGRRCASDPNASPCAVNNIRNAFRDHTKPVSDFIAIRDTGYANLQRVWQVLSPDIIEKSAQTGKPCLTSDGYLVSMTADVAVAGGWNRVGDCDQSKWIDALTVPAIVLPKKTASTPSQFLARGVAKRSLVTAISRGPNRQVVHGVVGDFGPANEMGEASIAMNRALNGLPETEAPKHRQDAIDRFQAGRSAILLFPGDGFILDRPISGPRIATAGQAALTAYGGADHIIECIKDEIDPAF